MTNVLGIEFPTPNITGLLSSSWIYIAVISIITIIAVLILAVVLFFATYNIKVEVYENIGGGSKMVRTIKTRARRIKVGKGGEELLHLLRPRVFRTAYGKKIAPNTYAFIVGEDGYWRNSAFGDYNFDRETLTLEPVDKDVRLAYTSIGKIIDNDYNPNKTVLIAMSIFLAVMTLIWIVGAYIIISKFSGTAKELNINYQQITDKFSSIANTQAQTSQIIANAKLKSEDYNVPSGLTPANLTGGGG